MTKHNGKARNAGDKVGKALLASRKKGRAGPGGNGRHTTELHGGGTNMQSVLERNDLDELMAMADLAGRDFTAERSQVVVISNGTVDAIEEQRAAEERAAAEERNRHRLKLPRRPSWDESTTPEQLDAQERTAFVAWRRDLALLEEQEKLVLTPFEKNLEVWRQLWRVLERSDIVVQVVDARDPMLYRCEDLEAYARELNACKGSLLLLNKADLLPLAVRQRWADYLDKIGMPYAFWSAVAVIDHHAALRAEAQDLGLDWKDLSEQRHTEARLARLSAEAAAMASGACGEAEVLAARRTRVLGEDELVALLEERAREAVLKAGKEDPQALDHDRKLTVGLVGYPNVGKSSTINALFGAKKTAVAPTPGKTKHFQTLVVSPTLSLCDCPGLVMPKFARSKAEMVAAGVIPIDRLTEIRAPVEVLASRVGRGQMEQLYGFKLPPAPVTAPGAPPTAEQVLRALATGRGWVVGSGLPDESRAGRLMLRDYTSGRLLHCTLPPGSNPSSYVPFIHDPNTLRPLGSGAHATRAVGTVKPAVGTAAAASSESEGEVDEESGALLQGATQRLPDLDDADLDLLAGAIGGLEVGPGGGIGGSKPKRADHKFQKKAARSKGDRGQGLQNLGGYDGAMVATGKKGGLLRVG